MAATSFILSGPIPYAPAGAVQLVVGTPSGNFTLTPNAAFTGTVALSDSDIGKGLFAGGPVGTFSPTSLTFSNSATPQTFTYTANSHGIKYIKAISSPDLGFIPPIYAEA